MNSSLESYMSNLSLSTRKSSTNLCKLDQKKRLRPNNILIEHEEEYDNEYVIINPKNSYEPKPQQLSSSFVLSNDYESTKLQSEIENMKKMRTNYGTDWLLSTPNLLGVALKSPNMPKKNSQDRFLFKKEKSLDRKEESSHNLTDEEENLSVLETFAVYRSFDLDQSLEENQCLCILCVNDRYLIEKDETNSKILSLIEYSKLGDIEDMTKLKSYSDNLTESSE